LLRSQVREKLLSKRREKFNKEKGQEVLQQLSDSRVVPVRVLVDVDLRQTLRLTRREKKARLFIPVEATSKLSVFLDYIYQAFPVEGMPHNMVVKVRRGGSTATGGGEVRTAAAFEDAAAAVAAAADKEEEEGEEGSSSSNSNSMEDLYITLVTDADLVRAFSEARKEGQMPQLYIKTDKTAAAAMVPSYLRGMPDPRQAETMQMVSFYKFFAPPIEDELALDFLAKKLRAVWEPFGALGRVYVASEGINAQMAVPATVFSNFAEACASLGELKNVFLNRDREVGMEEYMEEPAFDALHIRIREQVVADGGVEGGREGGFDWEDCGVGMSPREWHEKVDDAKVLVLDCRNEFESEVGRFVSAEPLNTSFFRESWDVLKRRLVDVPRETEILTYCTGGIRCIKVGAYLKQELGFENVARLEGGIVSYARHLREEQAADATAAAADAAAAAAAVGGVIPGSKFKGINYVFDNRLGERITEDILAQCDQCGTPSDNYVNCANPNCHVRFLQCSSCGASHQHCCSRGCIQALHELEQQPPKGGYPAPPRSVYPPGVEEACPLLPLSEGTRRSRKRVWLQPGPFQNVRLNRGFDLAMDAFMEAEAGTLPESDLLQRLSQETEGVFPGGAHMLSGHSQGRLMAVLTKAIGARSALEIGTFTGYATLCLAEGLAGAAAAAAAATGGDAMASPPKVVTCEIDDRAANIAQKYFDEAGATPAAATAGAEIELHREPAMDLLKRLAAIPEGEGRPSFDVIFLDGDKKRYIEYYDFILEHKLLSGGGIMIADNVLWKGLVPELGRRIAKDGEEAVLPVEEFEALGFSKRQVMLTKVLHDFNMHVRADMRTEQAFLPIRDGLLIMRWKGFERTTLPTAAGAPPVSGR
jgi:predicted sulfurtransferase/predicted O-methyltransferase YrrM